MQDLSVDPSSSSARQVVISSANSLVTRFGNIESQLQAIDSDIDVGLRANIQDLNGIATALADLNQKIVEAKSVTSGGQNPNGLLDQRDQLILELSEIVAVSTLEQPDGAINVFIGTGQSLVVGNNAQQLVAIQDPARWFQHAYCLSIQYWWSDRYYRFHIGRVVIRIVGISQSAAGFDS